MNRLSGMSLAILIFGGLLSGVMIAADADSPAEATLEIDGNGQMYIGGEPVGDPMTTEDGTPITQLDSGDTPIADHPLNVIEWSPMTAYSSIVGFVLTLVAVSATASAQFILVSPAPVEWWVAAIEVGVPLGMLGYTAMHVRRAYRELGV